MLNHKPDQIVLLTVDSLRKDRVTEGKMPALTALRDDGIWFDQMVSTAPATAASFVGIMASRFYSDVEGIGLPDAEYATLAESLPETYHNIGYSTNQFTSSYYNYDRGFDSFAGESQGLKFQIRKRLDEDGFLFSCLEWGYQQFLTLTSDGGSGAPSYFNTPAQEVNAEVRQQIEDGSGPTFAWVHHMDPHHPYEPPIVYLPDSVLDRAEAQTLSRTLPGKVPDEREEDLQRCIDLYDAECMYWDEAFAEFYDSLPEDTLTIVVGDHGELLGEHGRLGHPHEMWEELVNVPALIHHPDLPDVEVSTQQTMLDLAPTILSLLGEQVPQEMRGEPISLPHPDGREQVFGTIETPENIGMVRTPTDKWVRHKSRRSTQNSHGELLFLKNQPEDINRGRSRAETRPKRVETLRRLFEETMESDTRASGRRPEVDAGVKMHLKDLGYAQQR